jgi:hypothetical protein
MEFPDGEKTDQKQSASSPSSLSGEDRIQTSVQSQHQDPLPTKKRPWRKPKDMPKRPLSAYNLFFADERKELLKSSQKDGIGLAVSRNTFLDTSGRQSESHRQKLGFAGLARTVATKWKALGAEARFKYEQQAELEKSRYQAQMKKYNEQRLKSQHQATTATNSGQSGSSPIWPAMPQTIANLGNIYDTTSEQLSQRPGLIPFKGVATMGTLSDAASGLVTPKGSVFGTRPEAFPSARTLSSSDSPADSLVFPQRLHQLEAERTRRASSAGQSSRTAAMVHWNNDTALARRLSSPDNISLLAAELGKEEVDLFLRSVNEGQDDEEEEIN